MRRKALFVLSILIAFFVFQTCSSNPERTLLERYFHAVALNDNQTMSTMAYEPLELDVDSWEIMSVSEEEVSPAVLPDLNQKEMELKKQEEDHVIPVLDAQDALYNAQDELDLARTSSARNAARKKVEAAQAAYDEEYAKHSELRKAYNDAKAVAEREEDITAFSLNMGDLPIVRSLTGNVHFKEVDIKIRTRAGSEVNYRTYLRMYDLEDESGGTPIPSGRWIILNFQPLD